MNDFDRELSSRLDSIRATGLHRELRTVDSCQSTRIIMGGQTLLNFSSNDYLGLASHPELKLAAQEATERYGAGSGASRLISGSLAPHRELDDALAAFKGTEAALSFATGYGAAMGTICALVGKGDILVIDKLVHASIVDAARLSGAKLRVFDHNDTDDLERILKWADKSRGSASRASESARILIVTESVFSMDGDHAPLKHIVALKEKYGAWLMVDEAHGTGLYGTNRRGLTEELGLSDRMEVQMGTLGKALGAAGGFICGSRSLVDFLINRARTFIFSTAPVPAAVAAATAGVRIVQSAEGEKRRQRLWQNAALLPSAISKPGGQQSAIVPIIIGKEADAVEAANILRLKGIFIPAIRYPTVQRGEARLRLTLTADHTPEDLAQLKDALILLNRKSETEALAAAARTL